MGRLPTDKNEQEDVVVGSLLHRLAGQGRAPELIDRPDRGRGSRIFPGLTTDAVLELEGAASRERWSVDVMALAAPVSHFQVPDALISALTETAQRHGVVISVAGEAPDVREVRTIAKSVDAAIRGRPGGGLTSGEVAVSGLTIGWARPTVEEVPTAQLAALLLRSPSPRLSDQVAATIRDPLRNKATKQAAAANAAGLRSAVALDRTGHAGIAQGTHWLPQFPFTIGEAVADVLDGVVHYLDAVLLLDQDGDWHSLLGEFPGFGAQ